MARFMNLMKNEYIKMLKKVSTKIMLGLVLVAALAFIGLSMLAKIGTTAMNDDYSVEAELKDRVSYSQKEMESPTTSDADKLSAKIERDKAQFCIDNKILDFECWQMHAVDFALGELQHLTLNASAEEKSRYEAAIVSMQEAIKANDWKAFLNLKLPLMNIYYEQMQFSQEEREADGWAEKYCLEHDIVPDKTDTRFALVEQAADTKNTLQATEKSISMGSVVSATDLQKQKDAATLAEYRLKNEITYDVSEHSSWITTYTFDFWSVFGASYKLISFIGVLMIVLAGGIVASEFSQGTIKFLLINPVKRWKILLSKYLTAITIGYLLLLAAYCVSGVLAAIFFPGGSISACYYYVADGVVKSMSGFAYVLRSYLLGSVNIVIMATLAFAISSMVRSAALAIGVGLMAMFSGSIATSILGALQLDWARFLIFSNTDLQAIADGMTPFDGQTIPFALGIIAVHMFVFLLAAWDGFVRREV